MVFKSPGKIIFTSEYVVLKGALALSLPTLLGQSMDVDIQKLDGFELVWEAFDHHQDCWFRARFLRTSDHKIKAVEGAAEHSVDLEKMLDLCFNDSNSRLSKYGSYHVSCELDFDSQWGLGSSSSLIANLSLWSGVNAFDLLKSISKGSGYDVAIALENKALLYQLCEGTPAWERVDWYPKFADQLHFIHLGRKQKSELEVARFNKLNSLTTSEIQWFSETSRKLLHIEEVTEFIEVLEEHEQRLSKILNTETIKNQMFRDFKGSIKSLGAWGGDFILATGPRSDLRYFESRGFHTILSFEELFGSNEPSNHKTL